MSTHKLIWSFVGLFALVTITLVSIYAIRIAAFEAISHV